MLGLSTLAAKTLTSINFSDASAERVLISSIVGAWSMGDFPPASTDGPIMVGLAKGDYSSAEIEEFVEQTTSWNRGDEISQEVGRRKVKIVGVLRSTSASEVQSVLNDGKPIKTKLNWTMLDGTFIKMWAYNMGDSALTGNAQIHLGGHANLWPQ